MNYEDFLSPTGGSDRGNWFSSSGGILTDLSLFGTSWMHNKLLSDEHIGTTANFLSRNPYSETSFRTISTLKAKASLYGTIGRREASFVINPAHRKVLETRDKRLAGAAKAASRRYHHLSRAKNTQAILKGASAREFGGGKYYKGIEKFRNIGKQAQFLGVAFLVEGLAELALHVTTPGVSRVTRQREEMLFADESPIDSGGAWTQRQRAINAIHDSQLTTRAIIGQEASYLHR